MVLHHRPVHSTCQLHRDWGHLHQWHQRRPKDLCEKLLDITSTTVSFVLICRNASKPSRIAANGLLTGVFVVSSPVERNKKKISKKKLRKQRAATPKPRQSKMPNKIKNDDLRAAILEAKHFLGFGVVRLRDAIVVAKSNHRDGHIHEFEHKGSVNVEKLKFLPLLA